MSTCVAVLRSGDQCGIATIGRCTQCERPYCPSHINADRLTYAVCGRCRAEATERSEAATARALDQLKDVRVAFNDLFAIVREQLGSRGQVARQVQDGEKKVLFRGYVPTFKSLPAAWPIGSIKWLFVDSSPDGAQTRSQSIETGVTSAGELVPMDPPSSYGLRGTKKSYIDPDLSMAYQGLRRLAKDNAINPPAT